MFHSFNRIKHAIIVKGIFKRILKNVYHYLTINVRVRTENNIPQSPKLTFILRETNHF
jgi:hypothetical protein